MAPRRGPPSQQLVRGLRRGEVFALRWQSVNLEDGHLTVEEAVYEGAFGTPKTNAGAASRAVVRRDGPAVDGMEGARANHGAAGAGHLDDQRADLGLSMGRTRLESRAQPFLGLSPV